MKIGTYYYPEQWPREQWERDFDNIQRMGLQIVHMGEFAWFTMEPRPGQIELDWLEQCVEMAHRRNLSVILCTPTAAPPIWLVDEHPDVLPVDRNGTRGRFGGRRHYSPTSPALHEATKRIVTALAQRFGQHPAVIGWQIDNEYGLDFDQSEATHRAFRGWLRRKYGDSIEALNRAWGCQFWNTYYTSFDQILMPPSRDIDYANPHHRLDASRFWSWAWSDFNGLQARILKQHVGERFITTNFMPFFLDCDPGGMADDLTLMSWDSYPVSGWGRPQDQTYRLADPAGIGIVHDQMASYNGRWGLMELQPGHVNWSGVPVLLYPGAVRLWIWSAFAHGAEFVTTYRYRQPLFGTEMFHSGLVGTDGVTPSIGGREFMKAVDEVKLLKLSGTGPAATATAPAGAAPATARRAAASASTSPSVGLIMDFDQLWCYRTLPQAKRWQQPRWLTLWYAAIMRLGLRVRVLHPNRPWPEGLKIIVAPGVQMVDQALVERWRSFAGGGGHLVLTCRTGWMDRNGQLWEGKTAAPILDLIGGEIETYDGLPDDTFGQVELETVKYRWGVWGELLYAEPDTRVLARYADQFYSGAAAVIQRKHGSGVVTYCGVHAEGEFVDALMEDLVQQAGMTVTPLPPRVHILQRGPYRICLNYQDATITVPAPRGAKFVVGSRRLEPAGVAVWEA